MSTGKRIRMTGATSWYTSLLKGKHFKVQIRPILNLVYANAEEILSTERTAKILSELKTVQNVLEGF